MCSVLKTRRSLLTYTLTCRTLRGYMRYGLNALTHKRRNGSWTSYTRLIGLFGKLCLGDERSAHCFLIRQVVFECRS